MPPKRRTRANGEGSLYQRSSDGMWVGSVTLPNGKRKPVYSKTQAGARKKLKELQAHIEAGRPITSAQGVSLEKYLTTQWLAKTLPQRVAAKKLSQNTVNSYADNVRLHIVPHIGHVGLRELAPAHLREWLLELQQKPSARQKKPTERDPQPEVVLLSDRAVNYAHTVLRIALNDAMRDELVTRNVATLVDPPSGKSNRGRSLTAEEAERLLAAASGDRWADVWITILGLALRRGEALALTWSVLDLDAGVAAVGPSLQRVRAAEVDESGRRRGTLQVVARGKTAGSAETIPIPPMVLDVLRARKQRQAQEIAAAKVWVNPDLVFTTGVGTPIEPRNLNRAWTALCKRAGVDGARIHDLRHTAATLLFEEGLELKDIQGALRHTRLATTSEVYTHFTKKTQHRTTTAMDGALSRIAGAARRSVEPSA